MQLISEDAFVPACYYEWRNLDRSGFRPELIHCVKLRKEIVQQRTSFFPWTRAAWSVRIAAT